MSRYSSPANSLSALGPLDGRYAEAVRPLAELFSEQGLILWRLKVEFAWLRALCGEESFGPAPPLSSGETAFLDALEQDLGPQAAERVKELEQQTRHDVKAVELYLAERLRGHDALAGRIPMLHFACTSWDINSSAYGIMLARARSEVLVPVLEALIGQLHCMAREHAGLPMLARTHGQPASPTTLGKELAVFAHRLERQLAVFGDVPAMAKCSGATGNYNAHYAACPDVDWPDFSRRFLAGLGLEQNPVTTQIEPYDWVAEYCDALARINRIMIDLSRDAWTYISIGYFRQKAVRGETGSSTMPHKVNPINLENAEGNLGLSNALLSHFSEKLPVSRLQRDLSDSTVLRNLGVALGHALVAWTEVQKGLDKLSPDESRMSEDLDSAWETLAEAVQTVMRAHGCEDAYEQLKDLSRNQMVTRDSLHSFLNKAELPDAAREALLALTPATYTGIAKKLAE
ncbi:MAG: adenylosuccinate lyase [Gammaproteobacteria bacterium]|nr:adenylosuccinate lyase [Gammaproteobacteria bacterium]